MADAYKCDICGGLYEHYRGIKIIEKGTSYNTMYLTHGASCDSRRFDLCPKCMQKIVDFIKEGGDERKMD